MAGPDIHLEGSVLDRFLLEQILAPSADGFIIADNNGRLLFADEAAQRLARRNPEGQTVRAPDNAFGTLYLNGRPLPPEDYSLSQALRGETVRNREVRGVHEDGTFHDIAISASPIRDAAGAIVGAVASVTDVTARRSAEWFQRIAERVMDQSRDGISIIGRDYRYQRVNPVFLARHGLPEERVVGRHVAEVLGTANFETIVKPHFDRCLAGKEVQYEISYNLPAEGPRWLEIRYLPLRAEDGEIDAVVVVSRDVTERKETEERLRHARDAAEQANAAKSRFLAAASHDLRQPLQSMFLFAGALAPYVNGEAGRAKLELLERGLDTLKGLLDGLFDLSRLDTHTVTPNVGTLPLSSLVDDIAAFYAPIAASKGLRFQMDVRCQGEIRSDATLLGRMVRNLVENAIRFTRRGGVTLACVPEGKGVRIEVRDTGVGIAPEHVERVFEEFHQVANPERDRGQGLGLGLAIVRRLSRLLDHPVGVHSVPGQGSVFSILVPLAGAARPCAPAPDPQAEATGDGRLAVLVDDDAIVLLGLRAMFQEWGYATLIAGSTEQALDRLRGQDRVPDIVVADYRLREGRVGTEAILKIRELVGQPVPGIILTGEAGFEFQKDAAAHGLGVAHKPVTLRQLAVALERHLGTTEH